MCQSSQVTLKLSLIVRMLCILFKGRSVKKTCILMLTFLTVSGLGACASCYFSSSSIYVRVDLVRIGQFEILTHSCTCVFKGTHSLRTQNKGVNQHSKDVIQTQQRNPESLTVSSGIRVNTMYVNYTRGTPSDFTATR